MSLVMGLIALTDDPVSRDNLKGFFRQSGCSFMRSIGVLVALCLNVNVG